MRRREFMTFAGGLAGAAVAPALAAPALIPARRFTIALPPDSGLEAVAAAFRRAAGDIPLHPVWLDQPAGAVREGAVDLALLPLAALEPDCPGAGIIAGLPFGPGPEALAGWVGTQSGRRLWDAALAPAGLAVIPVAMLPAGRVLAPAGLDGLEAVAGVAVAAPGPTAWLWHRLGALESGAPAILDGWAEGVRGFGPRTCPVALLVGRGVPGGVRRSLERAARSLPVARRERPEAGRALSAELMVAAGNALPRLRREMVDRADPVTRAILADLLPLCGVEDAVLADAWPWTGGPATPVA